MRRARGDPAGRAGPGQHGGVAEEQTPKIALCRYRARVEKVESGGKVHIFYIDYGNVSGTGNAEGKTSPPWIHP